MTTLHILTESSNLLFQIGNPMLRIDALEQFRFFVEQATPDELLIPAKNIVSQQPFQCLGLAGCRRDPGGGELRRGYR